jgi:hypothetical protein
LLLLLSSFGETLSVVTFALGGSGLDRGPGKKRRGRVAAFTGKYGVDQVRVSAHHPTANRTVERGNKPIVDVFSKMMDGGLGNWAKNLSSVLLADLTSIHQLTRKTPF